MGLSLTEYVYGKGTNKDGKDGWMDGRKEEEKGVGRKEESKEEEIKRKKQG